MMRLQDENVTREVWGAVMRVVCPSGDKQSREGVEEIMEVYLDGIRGFETAAGISEREERERCINRMILALHCALAGANIPALWRYKIVSDAMDRLRAYNEGAKMRGEGVKVPVLGEVDYN